MNISFEGFLGQDQCNYKNYYTNSVPNKSDKFKKITNYRLFPLLLNNVLLGIRIKETDI